MADVIHGFAVGDYSLRSERVRTLHNGVVLEPFRDVAASARQTRMTELGIPAASVVLGLVGRMFPVKGQRRMIEMMPAIVHRCPEAVLLLVGDGPERPRCEARVAELNLARNVRFAGQRSDVAQMLKTCDLVVLPSESEGLPLAAIEAMAAGRPVVAFDVGGMREVIDDGQTGLLVPSGDEAAFTAAVLSLLQNREKLSSLGIRASDAAERFSMDHHVAKLLEHYRQLAADPAVG